MVLFSDDFIQKNGPGILLYINMVREASLFLWREGGAYFMADEVAGNILEQSF